MSASTDMRTLCVSVGVWLGAMAVGGCGPQASVDARNLVGSPLPEGRMAMLPPVLSSQVQYETLAIAFADEVLAALQKAGVRVAHDDLGGRLTARTIQTPAATSQPATVAVAPAAGAGLPELGEGSGLGVGQCYDQWKQAGFRTVCQPVIRQYGVYAAYVPPQVVREGGSRFYYYDPDRGAATGIDGGLVFDRGGGERGEGRGGREHGETDVIVGWGGPYYGYSYYIPGHTEPAAVVSVEFHIYDVNTHQEIYYILAYNEGLGYRPAQLDAGFSGPLAKAFRKAAGMK